jgi:hypothetical protein
MSDVTVVNVRIHATVGKRRVFRLHAGELRDKLAVIVLEFKPVQDACDDIISSQTTTSFHHDQGSRYRDSLFK